MSKKIDIKYWKNVIATRSERYPEMALNVSKGHWKKNLSCSTDGHSLRACKYEEQ